MKPLNRPHKEGLKLEGVENWKEQIAEYKGNDSNKVVPIIRGQYLSFLMLRKVDD